MRRVKRAFRVLWLTTAILAVAFAVMLTSVRLLLPLTEHYRTEMQTWITEALGRPVEVGGTGARWYRFGPELALRNVEIRDEADSHAVLQFDQVHIGIDLVSAIRDWSIQPTTIRLIGSRLAVERQADGRVLIQGMRAGASPEDDASSAARGALAWLFTREHLLLEDLDLTLIDRRRQPQQVQFRDIDIDLRNSGDRHRLAGRVQLSEAVGESIEFALAVEGEAQTPEKWGGRLFVALRGAELPQLVRPFPAWRDVLQHGKADVELWGTLQNGRTTDFAGRVVLADLRLADLQLGDGSLAAYATIRSDFHLRREPEGWSLSGDRLIIDDGANAWPPSRYALHYRAPVDSRPAAVALQSDYLDLEALVPLLAALPVPEASWRDVLRQLQPRGQVKALSGQVALESPLKYQVEAQLTGVATQRWEKIPGVTGLAGRVQADHAQGFLALAGTDFALDLPRWYEQPLPAATVSAGVAWQRSATGWTFEVADAEVENSDVHARGIASAEWIRDQGLFLDLSAYVERARGTNIAPYLPTRIMPQATFEWLRRGIVDGQVTGGDFVYRGWGRRYPFADRSGHFHIAFDVENAVLDYLPNWPRLEGIKAAVEFEQAAMRIAAHQGSARGAVIRQARAEIPNMKRDPRLLLAGQISATVPASIDVLAHTPLTQTFRNTLQKLRTAGTAEVDLRIDTFLRKGAKPKVKGAAKLSDAKVSFAGWPGGVESIDGTVRFSERVIEAQGLPVRVLAGRSKLDIQVPIGAQAKPARQGSVIATGRVEAKGLSELLEPSLAKSLRGTTSWRAVWRVPSHADHVNRFELTSALVGLEVGLPAPMGKGAQEAIPLSAIIEQTKATESKVTVRYGERLDAALHLYRSKNITRLARGEIRLGGGVAYIPAEKGLLVSGKINVLSLPEWRSALGGWGERWNLDAGPLQRIVLQLGTLVMVEKEIRDVRFALAKEGGYWQGILAGDGAKGSVRVPASVSDAPLVLNLDHLKLVERGEEASGDIRIWPSPTRMPPLEVSIGEFWLDREAVGAVTLKAARVKGGMRIDRFQVEGEHLQIEARGDWLGDRTRSRSTWEATLRSPDLGGALRTLGFVEGIKGGKTEASVQVSWPGPPGNPDLEGMKGRVALNVKSGRIVDIEPGAGRIFGLLSVQALPRRLLLDFRDLFMKGFAFDDIKGRFRIDSGDAYSDDLVVEGPAATLKIIGRTGLARRDYDQLVTVGPNLTGSLPLAGWAVGGPTLGAVMLFFQRIIGKEINEDSGIYYRVTGPWESPNVVRVATETPREQDGSDPGGSQ